MKNALSLICIAALLVLTIGCVTTPAGSSANVVKNGGFDQDVAAAPSKIEGVKGTSYWTFGVGGGGANGEATCVSEAGVLHIGNISDVGTATYAIQVIQSPIVVEEGYEYTVEFDAKASADRTIDVKVGGVEARSWADYTHGDGVGTVVELTTAMKTHSFSFTMKEETDEAARFEFQLGMNDADVWIDNVKLIKGALAK